ncbi:MAG: hypothetical protein ACD_51C00259G0015 [uncultured bacterium]|nr:MAG: hypothetical protein ACD_51C00259G0015 [uncultured bacterium]OGJ47260.1 MAG: hypothetical protein A2244_00235 [Candidatus Peregrinibacteria bacterium RIFOXYA2_FULL_41_18]OGJ48436.1 MAG: hypothetical protein A2344_05560 [Candidatus Peregrinibacteria bacterium RIFOXYB12_FULL_41_12]OGJ52845.1 MAG: hypothetical protein A2448_00820 [Candidatus Peregrinibacteria bacterium RIFOXYC2_FULL_41_22]OGJ54664.1 MAG: hypothetical protein A2336_05330 [Candidatus Peregrinibacteria bacterium RIFOXYB2_FULL
MLTPIDLLYITLAIAASLVTLFLCITLIYLILILRDANKVVSSAKDTVEKINLYVMKPVRAVQNMGKYMGPIIKIVEKKIEERLEEDDKPKKKK